MRGPNEEPIGEYRLVLAKRHLQLDVALTRQVTELAREADAPLPTAATAAGDRDKLRGIPVCGVGGAMRGTRPDRDATMGKLWSLAQLAHDIPGASPGTQPEEALMAKEDRAARSGSGSGLEGAGLSGE